ncbi:MAG: hypothetical protein EHM21_08135, partial [Chloroflexi bacterium]
MTHSIDVAEDRKPAASRLGLALFIFNMLLLAGLVGLHLAGIGNLGEEHWFERFLLMLVFIAFATTGALITTRRPENMIGWIFSGVVFLFLVEYFAEDYALYSLVIRPGALPGGVLAAWLGPWLGTVVFGSMLTFTFLLFPNGRFLSPRWRAFGWIVGALIVVQALAIMLNPGPLPDYPDHENPLGIEAAGPLLDWIVAVAPTFGSFAILLSTLSLLLRYRRARGIERLQIQWIALGAALPVLALFLVSVFNPRLGENGLLADQVFNLLIFFSIMAFPVTTAIAILRYRLYDIEFILRRTLIYATLTGLLALVYFGSVVMLQQVFRAGWGGESPVAIVISTLVIAALFSPLRQRIQALIDRRFYRRRYDADQILQNFTARLRDEVELEPLSQ